MRHIAIVVFAVASFLIFPDGLGSGDILMRLPLFLAVALVLTLVLVHVGIRRSLPAHLELREADDSQVPAAMQGPLRGFEALGFERAGNPLATEMGQEILIVPLVNLQEASYAAVYGLGNSREKVFYDVVTVFDGTDGSLCSGMTAGGGVLPAEAGVFRQLFEGASPARLVEAHGTALRWTEGHGLRAAAVDPADLPRLIRKSVHSGRRVFLRNPAVNTARALWRTVTRRNPHLGPLQDQPGAEAGVRALAATARQHRAPEGTSVVR